MSKPFIWTVVATLLFSVFAYFGFSPDLAIADTLGDAAHQAADAIATRNWILAGQSIVALGALIYQWVTGRRLPASR